MLNLTYYSYLLLAMGIFTSVTILAGYQILIIPSYLYYTWKWFQHRKFSFPKSSVFLILFMIVILISNILNWEVLESVKTSFGRLKHMAFGLMGFILLKETLSYWSVKWKKILWYVFLTSLLVAGAWCIWQIYGLGFLRAKSLTGTMRYGYALGMILPTLCVLFLKNYQNYPRWEKIFFALVLIFSGIGLILVHTRGAWLGFFVGLPLAIWGWNKPLAKLSLIFGLIACVGVGIYYLKNHDKGGEGRSFVVDSGSDSIRYVQWKSAWLAFCEKPLTGWGLSNFASQQLRIKEKHQLDHKDYTFHSHNTFLEVASGTGIFGILFFLLWLFQWARELLARQDFWGWAGLSYISVFIVSGQFEVLFDATNLSLLFTLYPLSLTYQSE